LVGSEMCIRDRAGGAASAARRCVPLGAVAEEESDRQIAFRAGASPALGTIPNPDRPANPAVVTAKSIGDNRRFHNFF
ncbi:MAG: hypothetical protein E6Z53_14470, partial [Pantoea sp.]|nr:hypothetical protein [Pantoea sp.]